MTFTAAEALARRLIPSPAKPVAREAPAATSEARLLLDETIAELEAEREEALQILTETKGIAAERLSKAVHALEEKLSETRAKRLELIARAERLARMKAHTSELKEIRLEIESGLADPERRERLRRRGDELRSELVVLLAASKNSKST